MTSRAEEETILATRVSEERRRHFLERYKEDRKRAATTETLFRRVDAWTYVEQRSPDYLYGFHLLLQKAPFTDLANWAEYSTWTFAVAAERYLLARLEELLRMTPASGRVSANATELVAAMVSLTDVARGRGLNPSLIVSARALEVDDIVEMHSRQLVTGPWDLPQDLRTVWIEGAHHDIPILTLPEATVDAVYVVDLARFGHVTRFDGFDFDVQELTLARAKELLAGNQAIVRVPKGRPDTDEERLHQLMLHVRFKLVESCRIEERDLGAVLRVDVLKQRAQPATSGAVTR